MTLSEVMQELQEAGTEQNVKIYKRHGMGEPLFGVSFAHLNKLKKRIKRDHGLAEELWATKNADARHLATMVADPNLATNALLDAWAEDMSYYLICDLLSGFAGQTELRQQKAAEWTASEDEWIGRAGWDLVGVLAMRDPSLSDAYYEQQLATLEADIHQSKNFTRHAMNMALISIGMRNAALKELAQAAAKRIGKVVVDHGETSCKTPDAHSYIEKAVAYKEARARKAEAKA